MPRKQGGLKHKLIIRVWGHSHDVMHSHGYLVDDVPIGLSGTIAELEINAQEMTFRQLRPMIEFDANDALLIAVIRSPKSVAFPADAIVTKSIVL